MKSVTAVLDPESPIVLPRHLHSDQVDYECELAVVIGKTCKNVAANVLYATAVTACVFSVMCASNFLSPATTFGVRMGSVIATHKKSLSWLQWLAEVISFGVHTGINRAGVAV